MIDVTVIIPVHNAEKWLDDCLQSVYKQDFIGNVQVSIFIDSSTDASSDIIKRWADILQKKNISVVVTEECNQLPKGVGYARNQCVARSSGKYLCFLDADDVMSEYRLKEQYIVAQDNPNCIIGSMFHREPDGSTERYTKWANSLTEEQLYTQASTSHGPTVIMPTWFLSRSVFDVIGGFNEGGKGTPEDLLFFYTHLELGGSLRRVNLDLLMYRYHDDCTTFTVSEETIWSLRMRFLQCHVISNWSAFTVWNAGKQGRRFYRHLDKTNKQKVVAFCDVDEKKIAKRFYIYEESFDSSKPKVPIVHFKKAKPPFVICVKLDLTDGQFEENLSSLNLVEGRDYIHFN